MSLKDQLRKIQEIAVTIGTSGDLCDKDLNYIVTSLLKVSDGQDVNEAFNLTITQGQNRKKHAPEYIDLLTIRNALIISEIERQLSNHPNTSKQQVIDTVVPHMAKKKWLGSYLGENTIQTIYRNKKKVNLRINF